MKLSLSFSVAVLIVLASNSDAYTVGKPRASQVVVDRRGVLSVSAAAVAAGLLGIPSEAQAAAAAVQDSLDVQSFLKTGMDAGGNMGVSSQAGKSRPQTGVVLRDGSDVQQDKQGNVLSEILTGTKANPMAVVASFQSPWKLETGPYFDVECRDSKTGEGAFMAVTADVGGKRLSDLSTDFLLDRLFRPEARFSFYGPPTDVKVKSSRTEGNYRYVELGFSTLSQSTNAEIPRKALLVATIPEGTNNAVMLVGSSNASRWKNGADKRVRETIESFRAVPAPKTGMKLRAKQRGPEPIEF
ncbi:expressed unknown protein [Seminavis robusta]|uniref:Uncharacterized protein n=1 Tax=Seminavis robusta TaxID=568900 RepID=A0A9N8F2C9_9STRA|nr:expressed unknown protein [Seminavis robusta]|eukprot:Sro2987_g341690.1 n/a (299) ;mRNA; r:1682-2578